MTQSADDEEVKEESYSMHKLEDSEVDDPKVPAERNSHTFVREPRSKKAYLFGGANHTGPLGDLWEFDESS